MGIYIVKSKYSNWYKLGHHKITKHKPNPYFRYINRGFNSCKCPKELENKVNFNDLELIYWFPNLSIRIEREIHIYLKKNRNFYDTTIGEWYSNFKLEEIKDLIINKYKGYLHILDEKDLLIAQNWCNKINKNQCYKIENNITKNNTTKDITSYINNMIKLYTLKDVIGEDKYIQIMDILKNVK